MARPRPVPPYRRVIEPSAGVDRGVLAVLTEAYTEEKLENGTERIVLLAETAENDPAARATLQTRAQQIASDVAGTPPDEVVLVPPRQASSHSASVGRR